MLASFPSTCGASSGCGLFQMDAFDNGCGCAASSEWGRSAGGLPSGYLCDSGFWSQQLLCFPSESLLSTVGVQLHRGRGVLVAGGRRWGSLAVAAALSVGPSVSATCRASQPCFCLSSLLSRL